MATSVCVLLGIIVQENIYAPSSQYGTQLLTYFMRGMFLHWIRVQTPLDQTRE